MLGVHIFPHNTQPYSPVVENGTGGEAGENVENIFKKVYENYTGVYTLWFKLRGFCMFVAVIHLILSMVFFGLTSNDKEGKLSKPVTNMLGIWVPASYDVMTALITKDPSNIPGGTTRFPPPPITQELQGLGYANTSVLLVYDESVNSHNALQSFFSKDKCPIQVPTSVMAGSNTVPGGFRRYPVELAGYNLNAGLLIAAFHLLSFAFQMASAYMSYKDTLKELRSVYTRFVEYSFSAPVMALAMALQLEVHDQTMQIMIFVLIMMCMKFGLIAEILYELCDQFDATLELPYPNSNPPPPSSPAMSDKYTIGPYWLAHICGWACIGGAFVGLLMNIDKYVTCIDKYKVPDFVMVIIATQVIFFCMFGFVQIYRFKNVSVAEARRNGTYGVMARNTLNVEWAYIMLSLVAKTVLSVSIFAGNLK